MSENTVEVTLKLVLEIPREVAVNDLHHKIEEALSGSTFSRKLWELGSFVDAYVQKVEERNVVYFVDEE